MIMWNKHLVLRCRTLLISAGLCASASAATLTVGQPNNSCPNGQYDTIGAAVKAAASGDVIEICPAVYSEQVIISEPLTLRGISSQVGGLGVNRVLLQPVLQNLPGQPFQAVIT